MSRLGGAVAGWLGTRVVTWVFALLEDTMLDITVSLLAGFLADRRSPHRGTRRS